MRIANMRKLKSERAPPPDRAGEDARIPQGDWFLTLLQLAALERPANRERNRHAGDEHADPGRVLADMGRGALR